MKTCTDCGQVKPLSEFYENERMADNHINQCKPCFRRQQRERHAKYREQPTVIPDKYVCTRCGVEKDGTEFYKNISKSLGINSKCKACISELNKARR